MTLFQIRGGILLVSFAAWIGSIPLIPSWMQATGVWNNRDFAGAGAEGVAADNAEAEARMS